MSKRKVIYPAIPLAQTVVRLCALKKIKHIVISAGSRNAPLTNGFVEDDFFKTYSVVDERAAAFFALGIAQQLKSPVALVCTSGSALLNYYPAVAEAYYSDIPLVVLSADRMPHRIDIGDGQTIRQTGVFEPHLEAAAYLKPDVSHATASLLNNPLQKEINPKSTPQEIAEQQLKIQQDNANEITKTLDIAFAKSGPVHLNIPLEEPLYGMTEMAVPFSVPLLDISKNVVSEKDLDQFKNKWRKAKKKMILVGVLSPDTIDKEIFNLICDDPSVVVLTEKTSNLNHSMTINSIDTLMAPLEALEKEKKTFLQPDILLTFGGMVVSKKIKSFLRNHPPETHWHVDSKKAYDTYYCLKKHCLLHPNSFLKALYSEAYSPASSYREEVLKHYNKFGARGRQWLKTQAFSDLKVFEKIAFKLPNTLQLQLANSSTIRYAQLFDLPKETSVFCNRGTSGIDGSTATAVGAAQISKTPTLLITGDLSFFYDLNGLWNNYIPNDFRILLINNSGGGIFRILPGEKDTPKYDTYFETIHQRNAKSIAKAFGFDYKSTRSMFGLNLKLNSFFKASSRPKILEIHTPRKLNDQILLDYFKSMV